MEFWDSKIMLKELIDPPRFVEWVEIDKNGKVIYKTILHGR